MKRQLLLEYTSAAEGRRQEASVLDKTIMFGNSY